MIPTKQKQLFTVYFESMELCILKIILASPIHHHENTVKQLPILEYSSSVHPQGLRNIHYLCQGLGHRLRYNLNIISTRIVFNNLREYLWNLHHSLVTAGWHRPEGSPDPARYSVHGWLQYWEQWCLLKDVLLSEARRGLRSVGLLMLLEMICKY